VWGKQKITVCSSLSFFPNFRQFYKILFFFPSKNFLVIFEKLDALFQFTRFLKILSSKILWINKKPPFLKTNYANAL